MIRSDLGIDVIFVFAPTKTALMIVVVVDFYAISIYASPSLARLYIILH